MSLVVRRQKVLTDVYVLAPERSAAIVAGFLDRFLPHRQPSAGDYEVPQYSDNPLIVFRTTEEAIQYSVTNETAAQRIYWNRVGEGEPRNAHVYFLGDGGLILGLSVAESTEPRLDWWLEQLKAFAGSPIAYYVCETPPVDSVAEFKRLAK